MKIKQRYCQNNTLAFVAAKTYYDCRQKFYKVVELQKNYWMI